MIKTTTKETPRSKSSNYNSRKTQSSISQKTVMPSNIFSGIRSKFPDTYDIIESHLDWDWAEEFKTIVENEKCVPDDPKYKWDGKNLTEILNTLINENQTTEIKYNRILRKIVNTIFSLNKPDECEIKKLNHQLYIFAECASKRPYGQNTLEYILDWFKNLIERQNKNMEQFIHIESKLLKPCFFKSRTSVRMYLLLQFYTYYLKKIFVIYNQQDNTVGMTLDLNKKPTKDIIIYILSKLNSITAYFAEKTNFRKIKDKNIKQFKELYFQEVTSHHPYFYPTKRTIFLGNEITRNLLISIDEMIVARESRRKKRLDDKRKLNLSFTANDELSVKIPSFTREEKESMTMVLSFYKYKYSTMSKMVCELRKIETSGMED